MTAPLTLALDAATPQGSVAIVRGATVLAERAVGMRAGLREVLLPAVTDALADAGVAIAAVERIVCGAGPGGFTGLRIAASIAKGLATTRAIPLHGVSSLALIVAGVDPAPRPGRYLAVLDALRGDVFASTVLVEPGGTVRPLDDASLVARADVAALAAERDAVCVGPAEALERVPHARGVARMAAWLAASAPVDLASWEPAYGRLAEAQVRWERVHGRALPAG